MADVADDVSDSDDISDWEIEEGLPQFEDQFIQQYYRGREALIEQESSQRSDNAFRQSCSPMATEACSIVSRILKQEREQFKTQQSKHPSAQDELTMYSGMPFFLAKDVMETTKSWQIVKRLPKGALLHAHLEASLDIRFVIETALNTPGMTIHSDQSLATEKARAIANLGFQFTHKTSHAGSLIWTDAYATSERVSLKDAAESFPNGGYPGFRSWLVDRCTITAKDRLDEHRGVDDIWQKFTGIFPVLYQLQQYEPIFRSAARQFLLRQVQDGVKWIELRLVPNSNFVLTGQEETTGEAIDQLRVWHEEVVAFQKGPEGHGFWGCRLIYTCVRTSSKKEVVESMKACIDAKVRYPGLICGFDVVGQEDFGRSLAELTPEFFWFKKRCMEKGVDIPFFFHAGECLGDGDDADQNLFDAILLGTRRIGHGFSLHKHPLLIEMVKTKKILIESCPISNEMLRLSNSVKSHSLPAILARGVSCSLSSDDQGVFDYSEYGVSADYWQALQGWENQGLAGLGSLAENSVRWASFSPDQPAKVWIKDISDGMHGSGIRADRLREWRKGWDSFCEWIVKEYAVEYGGDPE